MASTNGGPPPVGAEANQAAPQLNVLAQYIKDLSFENPNIERLLKEPGDQPNLQLSINVGAKAVGSAVRGAGMVASNRAPAWTRSDF